MKTLKISLVLLTALLFGCETEIPLVDNTDPEFFFQITGDGFSQNFDQDTDFSSIQLNLRDNTRYEFTFSGSDDGGVQLIQLQSDTRGALRFELPVPHPWTSRITSVLTRMIEWHGDPNNPLTGSILTSAFTTQGDGIIWSFHFRVHDFGGQTGVSNTSEGILWLNIGNHATEVVPR